MTKRRFVSTQKGFAIIYMAVFLTVLTLFVGLALDSGRAYIVKAQLSKAVDGAALGAARMLNSGDPKGEASRIFKANFPAGYMATTSVTEPTTDANFFALKTVQASGVNVVTVTAVAVMPTTFMKLGGINEVTVRATGEATRRMVDLSLVIDVSGSIGSKWTAVRDASRTFIDSFDQANDRVSLLTFSDAAKVLDAMPSSRGFAKSKLITDVPATLPGGSTNMVEGLYRGWDELRSVPSGTQSGLRVIVLFTDGASNSVPASWDAAPGLGRALRTYDFPKVSPDPDSQTWNDPQITGLYDTATGATSPSAGAHPTNWNNPCFPTVPAPNATCAPNAQYMPAASFHANHRSSGIPTSFALLSPTLTVNGAAQSSRRPMRNKQGNGRYPAEVFNINNAARNLVEIIANEARKDTGGDYPIRIYTIGMGELVRYDLGTLREKSEDILKRMANDKTSPDFNATQLEGKYYFAKTEADVGPAFQALQNQIIRLSK